MYCSVRIIIATICLVIGIIVVRHTGARKKKWVYVIIICGAFMLASLLYCIPFENLFVSFSSPEEAYHYYEPYGDVQFVSEGTDSAFVYGEGGSMAIKRKKDGWGFFASGSRQNTFKNLYRKTLSLDTSVDSINHTSVSIIYVPGTTDYYVMVSSTSNPVTVEDSIKSEYSFVKREWGMTVLYTAYAYLGRMNENYTIVVNGEQIYPFGKQNGYTD